MSKEGVSSEEDSKQEVVFEDLEKVAIADEDLEKDDETKRSAKKQAKKLSKTQRSPEEKNKQNVKNSNILWSRFRNNYCVICGANNALDNLKRCWVEKYASPHVY